MLQVLTGFCSKTREFPHTSMCANICSLSRALRDRRLRSRSGGSGRPRSGLERGGDCHLSFILQCFVDFFCFLSVVDCENHPDYYVYYDENSEPD